ncbi:uncharacterized protein LOC111308082 [Durio zibethinus]|uniref:Uncharacterized protein LOC111308082 n=1 Tax=Durio zibethinus TaxID=66656 RepID=A0A6P6ABD7_DURZI|nr:uncharacterized protein LOC111308082 [Durio zibethinus]
MDPTITIIAFPLQKQNKTACNRAVSTTFYLSLSSLLSLSKNATRSTIPTRLGVSCSCQRATMSSIIHNFQRSQALPVSQTESKEQLPGLRRRLSSLSLKLQPISCPAASWTFPRSKSLSSMGEYAGSSIRKWWDWGWSWVLSRKPMFAQDLEMNEEETRVLGCHNKGSWRHVFYKVRSEIKNWWELTKLASHKLTGTML